MPSTLLDERILTASTSVTMTKRRADDKGQPCLIPLLILIGSDIQPLLDITGVIFEYITFTHLRKHSLNLNFFNDLNKKLQSILSNAFLKSISKIAPSQFNNSV